MCRPGRRPAIARVFFSSLSFSLFLSLFLLWTRLTARPHTCSILQHSVSHPAHSVASVFRQTALFSEAQRGCACSGPPRITTMLLLLLLLCVFSFSAQPLLPWLLRFQWGCLDHCFCAEVSSKIFRSRAHLPECCQNAAAQQVLCLSQHL